eukprot:3011332-Heterocapsa_arctica.AAC.1
MKKSTAHMPPNLTRPRRAQRTHFPAINGADAVIDPKRRASVAILDCPKRGSFRSPRTHKSSRAFVSISVRFSSDITGCGVYMTPASGAVRTVF